MMKYIIMARKAPGPDITAAQLDEEEQVRRSTWYVINGMRQPTQQEAQNFLTVQCKQIAGKQIVWKVTPYKETFTTPSRIIHLDKPEFPVFDWDAKLLPDVISQSGWAVNIVTGCRTDDYGTEFAHMLFAPDEVYDNDAVQHDLAIELRCSPEDVANGRFTYDADKAVLPMSVVSGIRRCAEADTLRALGRYINDLYLTESPSEADDEATKKEKECWCDSLQMVLDVIHQKLNEQK